MRILHLENNTGDAELIAAALEAGGLGGDVTRVATHADFLAALEGRFDLILADHTLPAFDGLSALKIAQENEAMLPLKHLLSCLPILCPLLLGSAGAHAQTPWPAKVIRLVVPFAALLCTIGFERLLERGGRTARLFGVALLVAIPFQFVGFAQYYKTGYQTASA